MAIMRADVLELKDNRVDELIAFANDVKTQTPRIGAKNFHLTRLRVGSTNAHLCLFSGEWESYADHGAKFPDAVRNDSEWQALMRSGLGPEGPARYLRTQFGTKVAQIGPEVDVGPGGQILVRFWDVKPGRFDEFMKLVHEAAPYVQQHGASTTLLRMSVAGQEVGSIVSITPFRDMATVGSYLDTIESHPSAKQSWSKLDAPDPPMRQVSMRIDAVLL